MSFFGKICAFCAILACFSAPKMSAFCSIIQNSDIFDHSVQINKNESLYFQPTSVVYKPDDGIIRVKGNLVGRPHTSNRIDSATLTVNGTVYQAVDIDGIDFERYFQWDDDGLIPLEIDFKIPKGKPLPKLNSKSVLTLNTLRSPLRFKASK